MARGINLSTSRPLRLVEEMNGFSCVVLNREGSRLLGRQIMFFHLAMMAAFMTVIGAPFAWLAAFLNILLSPKVSAWRIECSQHAIQISELYMRKEPGVEQARSDIATTGPKVLGLGETPPPLDLPLSEISDMGWSDHDLWFAMNDGSFLSYALELTTPEDIDRLGTPIKRMWERFAAGATMSEEEATAERQKLAALIQQGVSPG